MTNIRAYTNGDLKDVKAESPLLLIATVMLLAATVAMYAYAIAH